MNEINFLYCHNISLAKDIDQHFKNCDSSFYEQLANNINILEYSNKIEKYAQRFEAWDNLKIVGLIAAYFNDIENMNGYITNVSVINSHVRQGIASKLMQKCIDFAVQNSFRSISLEVSSTNFQAIHLYNSFNFVQVATKNSSLIMQLNIKNI